MGLVATGEVFLPVVRVSAHSREDKTYEQRAQQNRLVLKKQDERLGQDEVQAVASSDHCRAQRRPLRLESHCLHVQQSTRDERPQEQPVTSDRWELLCTCPAPSP